MLRLPENISDCANALARKTKEVVKEDSRVLLFQFEVFLSKKDSFIENIQQGQSPQVDVGNHCAGLCGLSCDCSTRLGGSGVVSARFDGSCIVGTGLGRSHWHGPGQLAPGRAFATHVGVREVKD